MNKCTFCGNEFDPYYCDYCDVLHNDDVCPECRDKLWEMHYLQLYGGIING